MEIIVKHGHWKVYGYSYTCSNCGHCRIGSTKYCMGCGSLMDEMEEYDIPKFTIAELPVGITCPFCNNNMFALKSKANFCEHCGAKL